MSHIDGLILENLPKQTCHSFLPPAINLYPGGLTMKTRWTLRRSMHIIRKLAEKYRLTGKTAHGLYEAVNKDALVIKTCVTIKCGTARSTFYRPVSAGFQNRRSAQPFPFRCQNTFPGGPKNLHPEPYIVTAGNQHPGAASLARRPW